MIVISELQVLPDTAIDQLPSVLKNETKKQLCELNPVKSAHLLADAIEEINKGSIETLDALVNKRL